ncbi:MAG: zinc-binding alcohol dehydrogenase family protein [Bacteroidales bacterium]|jgi:threonine dehydrogenase-like Zn-dependent dehydrogenase|nr:zinc-binding alcohol dehydrogenase family protein [Bacteroidales bacterium]
MKALQIPALQTIKVVELAKPEVKAGEVLLKLKYVGFCGSDLNTFLGRNAMAKANVIPGHEIGAVIEAVGEGCPDTLKVGQVVTVNPYTNCGHCASCRNGRVNACKNNETLGVQRDGAMREFISLPWQKIIPVKGVSARDCALIEPMSVGFHAVDRGQVTDIDTVLVFGCGMVGLGAIVRAVQRGAVVIACDLSEEKLALAKSCGAAYGINSKTENVVERINEITDGMGADVVIEAVGSPITYQTAIDAVGFTGRVVCIGYSKNEVSFQTKYFVQKELDILGSRNAMPNDFRAVQRFMQNTNIPMEPFISGIIKPEDAQQTMEKWAANPGQVFRILVEF